MRRVIFSIFMILSFINAAEFSNKLPIELHQLVESFDCFTKRDKVALYSYALALRYRYEHLEDKEALKKSNLDYWRLWHIMMDIRYDKDLGRDFDNIIENILFPTHEQKKRLKKLRWAESSIRSDGSSESSKRMRQYDKKLLDGIMDNPHKWSFEDKNEYLGDYNLSQLKTYPEHTIASPVYDKISKISSENSKKRNFLLRYAYLQEEYLRHYDQKKERDTISKNLSHLSNCFSYFNLPHLNIYYGNFQRELVGKMLDSSFRKEMLPKAIKHYCENNIAYTKVDTFNVKPSKPIKQKKAKAIPTFLKTLRLIEGYHKQGADVKYHKEYITLSQQMLEGEGDDLAKGMRLLRLENCISTQNPTQFEKILKTSIQDMMDADYKDEYPNKVLRPMLWWKMTIAMKIDQEGETEELKHFFDCNASALNFSKTVSPKQKVKTIGTKKVNYNGIIDQKDQIFKYYAATFVNTPTPDLNNEKAIEAGIIPAKWVEANNTIKTVGVPLVIQGMPQGGVKLTYDGIPKGSTCERITTLNIHPEIFFDRKTYDGIDYLLIDGDKLKYRHFNGKHAKRLCNKQDMHTVSFVIKDTVVEKKYQRKEVDCQHDNYKKIKTIDTQRYPPNGIAVSGDHRYFTLSGSKSTLYHATIPAKVSNLPQELENAYYLAMDEFGIHIAVPQGRGFSFWNVPENRMITRLKYDHPLYDMFNVREVHFLPSNNILAAIAQNGQEVRILDPINQKMITKIIPKFFDGEKKSRYRGPRITALAIAHEGNQLFIGGKRKKIEIWDIPEDFGSNSGEIMYHDVIELPRGPEVGAIQPDPINPDNLYIAMRNNQLYLYSLTQKKITKTYVADSYMDPKGIQVSDDGKYIMVTGSKLFIWKTDSTVQFDIFSGDGIVGGLFKPFTYQVITAGSTVDRWELKN